MNERIVRIPLGGDTLLGVLHEAGGEHAVRAVLILVGGPQYRVGSHRQFVLTARHLAAQGHPSFRFDFRGMGDSTGDPAGFEHVREDVRAALDVLFHELPALRSVCVVGLCDAASAALLHCTTDPRVDSLVMMNPWVRTDAGQAKAFVKHYYGSRLLQKSFWSKLLRGGLNPFSAARGFLASVRASRGERPAPLNFIEGMLRGLQGFRGPVLLLSSGRDLTAREFDDLCAADVSWRQAVAGPGLQRVDLKDCDHTFSDREGLNAANAAIAAFLKKLQPGN